jgi:hypothetical protein
MDARYTNTELVRLSLEKYTAIVTLISQGGSDAANLVPVSELKEVDADHRPFVLNSPARDDFFITYS